MAVELATAYVSIVPSTRGFAKSLTDGIAPDVDGVGQKQGSRLGGALMAGVKKVGVGAAVTTGAALTGALVKGWGRLTQIEDAQAKLRGLGHDAGSVKTIMDNALASVKGTAFGLGDAATVAASTVAAGIKPGKDLERVLGLVGDAATIAGSGMSEMGAIFNKVAAGNRLSMGEVNQLSDQGIPILQMLADQYGVTALEARKMVESGEVDFAAFSKAIEDNVGGAALESGNTTRGAFANMGAAAGRFGAALLSGIFPKISGGFTSITGVIDKLTPAAETLSKVGGQLFDILFRRDFTSGPLSEDSKIVDVAFRLRDAITDLLGVGRQLFNILFKRDFTSGPLSEDSKIVDVAFRLRDVLGEVAGFIRRNIMPIIAGLGGALAVLAGAGAFGAVVSIVTTVIGAITGLVAVLASPIALIAALAAAVVFAYVKFEGFRNVVDAVIGFLTSTVLPAIGDFAGYIADKFTELVGWVRTNWASIQEAITHVINVVSGIVRTAIDVISALWRAWGDDLLNVAKTVWDFIGQTIDTAIKLVQSVIQTVLALINGDWGQAWDGIKGILSAVWDQIVNIVSTAFDLVKSIIGGVLSTIREIWNGAWEQVASFLSSIWDSIKSTAEGAWQGILDFFTGIPTAIGNVFGGLADLITGPFRAAFNGIADLWNNTVGKLSFTTPSWIPFIGGKSFNVPNIPKWSGPTQQWTGGSIDSAVRWAARAWGGPVAARTPYLVGERGPELFVPDMTGRIIPNHQLPAAGGRGDVNVGELHFHDVPAREAYSETLWQIGIAG